LDIARLFGRAIAGWSVERRDLLANHWIVRRFVNIELQPIDRLFILIGNIVVGEDGFDRTFGDARIAIDASVSVDIKTIC
jgi:hypothetical protein